LTIIPANWVDSDQAVIAVMSLAFFGQGMVRLGWTVISDVVPKHLMGLSGGIFNFCTNFAGIITPLVAGYIVAATGSFVWARFHRDDGISGGVSHVFIQLRPSCNSFRVVEDPRMVKQCAVAGRVGRPPLDWTCVLPIGRFWRSRYPSDRR
jgi:MFS family permease